MNLKLGMCREVCPLTTLRWHLLHMRQLLVVQLAFRVELCTKLDRNFYEILVVIFFINIGCLFVAKTHLLSRALNEWVCVMQLISINKLM